MIRLYMNVMLSVWKQIVKHAFKKKKPPVCSERLFKKPGSYNVFRSDWKGFFRILISVSFGLGRFLSELDFGLDLWFLFGFGLIFFGFGFRTRPLVSLRIWIGYFCRIGYIKCRKTGLQVKAREHSILS